MSKDDTNTQPKSKTNTTEFAEQLLVWFDQFGRTDLPWQNTHDPYRIWVSEIMLQQTQVSTVIPFYQRFMQQFPDIASLAAAEQDLVLHHWTGLGYYARARNLHRAAQIIVDEHAGTFPTDFEAALNLPGIGRSTAGAILSFAFAQHHAILDGNVKRVLSRVFGVEGWPGERAVSDRLWEIAERNTPASAVARYTQAIMDFGATLCKRAKPLCTDCPFQPGCEAYQQDKIASLPGKKPKKAQPVKTTTMLIIQNDQAEFFLQQRPPSGIWGGLWSFPEFATSAMHTTGDELDLSQLEADALNTLGLHLEIDSVGQQLRHTFSHYHLDITPVYARLCKLEPAVTEHESLWFDQQKPLQIGLAAPIKQLLQLAHLSMTIQD